MVWFWTNVNLNILWKFHQDLTCFGGFRKNYSCFGQKMFLLFSHLIDGKFPLSLTYLKSWWKVVLDFCKEHANLSNISGVMIGWSWKINQFFVYTNVEFSKLDFLTSSYQNSINTGPIYLIFTKKCNYFSQATRWNRSFLSQSQ